MKREIYPIPLTEQSENVEKNKDYFYALKSNNKPLFRLLRAKGNKRLDLALKSYLKEIQDLKDKTIEILHKKFNGVQYQFSLDLANKGLYSSADSATVAINKNVYVEDLYFTFQTLRKYRKIVGAYNDN